MPDEHAILSASASARWMHCTPSARLEANLPDVETSYAAEGTKAHAICEKKLKYFVKTGRTYKKPFPDVDGEMWEATEQYLDFCVERINAARKSSDDVEVGVETRLDFSGWVPEGFGTGDCVIVSGSAIEVVDFKYGKGVKVVAKGNTQMRLYALGAFAKHCFCGADVIRMSIVQPRIGNIDTDEISLSDLLEWGISIKPTAKKAFAGKGEKVPGDWCRFCKVRTTCRAYADKMLEGVKTDFEAVDLSPLEIAKIVQKAGDVKRWLTEVEEYAFGQLAGGNKIPGLKIVEGRSTRHITDEKAVADILRKEGYADADIWKPQKIQTITALEKLVGKGRLKTLLADYIVKPKGKPTLVDDSDERPAIELDADVADDFDDSLL